MFSSDDNADDMEDDFAACSQNQNYPELAVDYLAKSQRTYANSCLKNNNDKLK